MNWKTCLLWMSVLLVYPTIALGQITTLHFEILPGSTYTYFPGGFAGLDGCSPNDFQCDYALEGLFSVEIDSAPFGSRSASITNSNLVLTGNESVSVRPLTTESRLQAWLESQDLSEILVKVASPIGIDAFQSRTGPSNSDRLSLLYESPGLNGSLTGGFDFRAVDGDGLNFQATLRQVAVPEPSAATILGFLTVAAFYIRRRSR